jgi:hypothetical protein
MNTRLNLLFVFCDVMEQLMVAAQNDMRREGLAFKYTTKQAFTGALHNIRRLQREVTGCATTTQQDFCNDADSLYATLLTYADRVGDDDVLAYKVYQYLRQFESKVPGLAPDELAKNFSYIFEEDSRK